MLTTWIFSEGEAAIALAGKGTKVSTEETGLPGVTTIPNGLSEIESSRPADPKNAASGSSGQRSCCPPPGFPMVLVCGQTRSTASHRQSRSLSPHQVVSAE